jgi:hypothetical protein
MNTKQRKIGTNAPLTLGMILLVCAIMAPVCNAQSTDKFYYWVDGDTQRDGGYQSFVIEVDSNMKAQIEADWAQGNEPHFRAHIASGSVSYDKNYYSPTHAAWDWHVVSVDAIDDQFSPLGFYDPTTDDFPSDIAANPDAWIQQHGDVIHLRNFYIRKQIDQTLKDAVANVSNRGITGSGERVLITGFIVTGGEPRNVVVRVLGPSLSSLGVQQVAQNPKIDVYQGSRKIATNLDWKKDSRAPELSNNYPSLAPTNDREAALLLTLLPGAYTIQGVNEDGTEGVAVIEAYDVDTGLN